MTKQKVDAKKVMHDAAEREKILGIIAKWLALGGPDKCSITQLAHELHINRATLSGYLNASAKYLGIEVPKKSIGAEEKKDDIASGDAELKHQVATLKAQLSTYRKEELTSRYIRSKILGLAETTPVPPAWLLDKKSSKSFPGVPSAMASDWHWGEVISSSQVGGVNSYNLEIAHARAKQFVNTIIDLLFNHMVNPNYPGFVLNLGGDMLSGDIHDELKETNDIPLIPAVLDLFGVLIWCINTLADAFGRVFVPCVTGNHGRNTQKIRAKDRAFTSFDWMLYCLLERHFEGDSRVTFMVPEGPDAFYKVYDHRYLLTHGDQFRGGDGMIGALGPIIRGDHKKRSRNNQVGTGYDTLLLGHWHQLIQMNRLIVNGSLCGYNEYAYAGNFPFETPKQALWLTHPQHGITFSMPVHVDEVSKAKDASWVSISKGE